MLSVASKPDEPKTVGIFGKLLIASGLLAFLIYGLSFFFSKPTAETITTRPIQLNTANQPAQNIKFQSKKRRR